MNGPIKKIRSDRIVFPGFAATAVFIFFNLAYIAFYYAKLPPLIPIFNQLPWGDSRLGNTYEIFYPIVLVFILSIGNFFFSAYTYEKMPLISRILAITSLLISFLSLIFTIRVTRIIL